MTGESGRAARAERQRDETPPERLDRNTMELLNELRVANTGIQVMFAFLLVVPFDAGWKPTDPFERTVYFVTLLITAAAAFLLMAPAVHHRVLFRRGEKPFLLRTANTMAIAGMVCVALGFIGVLLMVSDFVVGGLGPVIVVTLAAVTVSTLWFGMPLLRRDDEGQ